MKEHSRTKITIQTRQTIVVHASADSQLWCRECQDEVQPLPLESVARFLQMPIAALYALLETGQLHVVEGAPSPMICCNSLTSGARNTQIYIEGADQ